jgi:hypothetical protein
MSKKKDIFDTILGKPKKVKKTKTKTQKEKILYILATMRFKPATLMFVRNLLKTLEKGKRITKGQSTALDTIYTEWFSGRPIKKPKIETVKTIGGKGRK